MDSSTFVTSTLAGIAVAIVSFWLFLLLLRLDRREDNQADNRRAVLPDELSGRVCSSKDKFKKISNTTMNPIATQKPTFDTALSIDIKAITKPQNPSAKVTVIKCLSNPLSFNMPDAVKIIAKPENAKIIVSKARSEIMKWKYASAPKRNPNTIFGTAKVLFACITSNIAATAIPPRKPTTRID